MKKSFLLALICLSIIFVPYNLKAQENHRIEKLEKRILKLERRVVELEKVLMEITSQGENSPVFSDKWKNISNWRKLQLGMSKSQVKQILGEPPKITADGYIGDTWYYPSVLGGTLRFDQGGSLNGWREP